MIDSPYWWCLLGSLCAGLSLSSLLRGKGRGGSRLTVAAFAASFSVVFILLAIFIPGKERFLDLELLWFSLVFFALSALGFRFPRAAGIPLILLLGAIAIAGASLRQGWIPFQSPLATPLGGSREVVGEEARIKVLSVSGKDCSIELDLARPEASTRFFTLGGASLRLGFQTMQPLRALEILGLVPSYRLVYLSGGVSPMDLGAADGFVPAYPPGERVGRELPFARYSFLETQAVPAEAMLGLRVVARDDKLELIDERLE
jgi:hypothetical protein